MLLPSDIPESTYGLPKDQFIAAIQADASMGRTGDLHGPRRAG